jgi:hypothetical protein
MIEVPEPSPIELTEEEQVLFQRIAFHPEQSSFHEQLRASSPLACDLMRSLLNRNAIPEIRKKYFTDPSLNIKGHGKSRMEVFEGNGTCGEDIFRHGNFLKYLEYFIKGPDLPPETISRFRQVICEGGGPYYVELDPLCKFVRAEARRFRGNSMAEEFFKLALECSLDDGLARTIRETVLRIKK